MPNYLVDQWIMKMIFWSSVDWSWFLEAWRGERILSFTRKSDEINNFFLICLVYVCDEGSSSFPCLGRHHQHKTFKPKLDDYMRPTNWALKQLEEILKTAADILDFCLSTLFNQNTVKSQVKPMLVWSSSSSLLLLSLSELLEAGLLDAGLLEGERPAGLAWGDGFSLGLLSTELACWGLSAAGLDSSSEGPEDRERRIIRWISKLQLLVLILLLQQHKIVPASFAHHFVLSVQDWDFDFCLESPYLKHTFMIIINKYFNSHHKQIIHKEKQKAADEQIRFLSAISNVFVIVL